MKSKMIFTAISLMLASAPLSLTASASKNIDTTQLNDVPTEISADQLNLNYNDNMNVGGTQYSYTNNNGSRNWVLSNKTPTVMRTNQGLITYKISRSVDPFYKKAINKAISQWNSLKVIKFVPVKSSQQISISGGFKSKVQSWNGNTIYDVSNDSILGTSFNTFVNTRVIISGHIIKKESGKKNFDFVALIARHELGHTLGFGHDNSNPTNSKYRKYTMNSFIPLKSTYQVAPIGSYEQQTLLTYYQGNNRLTQVPSN